MPARCVPFEIKHHAPTMRLTLTILTFAIVNLKSSYGQTPPKGPLTVTIKQLGSSVLKIAKDDLKYYQDTTGLSETLLDSLEQTNYSVEIELKNESKRPIFLWLMICSWEENFLINNDYIRYIGQGCDKNYPELVEISSGNVKKLAVTLRRLIDLQNPNDDRPSQLQIPQTKLGLILVDNLFKPKLKDFLGYLVAIKDKSSWNIVWSNPLVLAGIPKRSKNKIGSTTNGTQQRHL